MELNKYQKLARKTACYPYLGKNLTYLTLGLCGESGEIAEKVKKIFRDSNGKINDEIRKAIELEIGDVLWYLSNMCSELKLDLDDVAKINLKKIKSRVKRNNIKGNGDNR